MQAFRVVGDRALLALGAVPIDVGDAGGSLTFLPQSGGETEAKDFGALGSWSLSLDGVEDLVGLTQVFLPQTSRFAVDKASFRVVFIGAYFDAFFPSVPSEGVPPVLDDISRIN